jgi:nicotinate-nucleotide pyrophosphorylase (carboxylating)
MCVCGIAWFNQVFHQLNPHINITWQCADADFVAANTVLCTLQGSARTLLTGERSALNFLQLLSGTATITREYVALLKSSPTRLLDTRKTIPGWRLAQKYAVRCGGGNNHRMGLYDAFLIKENHIAAVGSITDAITSARRQAPDKLIEIEVENLQQLDEAIANQADIVLLDNFDDSQLAQAVKRTNKTTKLEVSGNITQSRLRYLADLGIDYISVGALTKHVRAIDLSMRLTEITASHTIAT